jgi:sugar phosphate isomerase/epimerase
MPDRRAFLRTLGAAAVAGKLGRPLAEWEGASHAAKLDRIGLQLYTVRTEMGRDFEGTLARVAQVGYTEVEFAGYFDRKPEAVKAALTRAGLVAPSAHLPLETVRDRWAQTLEDARTIGHRYVVVPWIPVEQRRTADDYKRIAELFNRAGAEARQAGLRFAYHNHDFEFAAVDGRVPYDLLLAETDPAAVEFEMDLYWVTHGGGDPLAYFARHHGRFPLVHVKDMDAARGMVAVGKGVIAWKKIFARRDQAGIHHYFVEHDQPPDPFASIRTSYEYLKGLEF